VKGGGRWTTATRWTRRLDASFEAEADRLTGTTVRSGNSIQLDAVAAIGSYNIANGSAFHHTESAVLVHGRDFAEQVRRQFLADFEDCKEVAVADTPEVARWADPFRRSLHERNILSTHRCGRRL
jgi:phosphatidylserine/phosphatidylglycerophosphate/cardiolipin synthase-like enzyme